MNPLSLEEHRARIYNICTAEEDNRRYFRRHRIYDYLPGQVIYHLGDYPSSYTTEPTEYDVSLLKKLSEQGAELIQIHEDWNDTLRRYGGDKFSSIDPKGLQNFVDLCHKNDLKIIPYISTGYFGGYDPDFQENFTRSDAQLTSQFLHYRQCWAGSEYWRSYIIPRTFAVVEQYGFDGVFNDMGSDGWSLAWRKARKDKKERPDFIYEPELEDLLASIYSELKHRGLIYKIHLNQNDAPICKDKIYDYLWIGEGTTETTPGIGKNFMQYVVPCPDFRSLDQPMLYHFARTIPFMQFPLLMHGRPLHGNIDTEGIPAYTPLWGKEIRDYLKEHPDGPYSYSEWSSIPDDPMYYTLWCKYLALYKPMVKENSVAYLELRDSAEILSSIPEEVYLSMFVNEEKYLVLSNLTDAPYTLTLRDKWIDRETDQKASSFTIAPGAICFLKKANSGQWQPAEIYQDVSFIFDKK